MMVKFGDRIVTLRVGWWRAGACIALATIGLGLMFAPIGAAPLESPRIATRITAQVDATAVTEPNQLAQCIQKSWLHSMEEDSDEVVVYRPEGYPFPPARGRIGFEFLAGGYLIYHGFGPADEELLQHGRWEQPGHSRIVIEIDEPGKPVIRETWNVHSCSEELLELARSPE